jgi:nucleoside-diphosphate-sugar epimerase
VKPLASEDLEYILRHTLTLWQRARGERIFISGGTGFMGVWLLESLDFCNRELSLGISATVLSRDPKAFTQRMPHFSHHRSIRFIQGGISDFAFPAENHAFVIHAATPTSANVDAGELLKTQVNGTERILLFAKARATTNFLFVSSGAVYGRQPEGLGRIPEDYLGSPDWLDPNAVYAEGKRVSEQMCAIVARDSDIRFTIARAFAFVGPHLPLDQHFAIGNFIGDAIAGRKITIRGDGTPMRSYLYSADLAIWLWTMLLRETAPQPIPNVFNVGSGEAISIRDLAVTVAEEINPSIQIETVGQRTSSGTLEQYVPDVRKAETVLGLHQLVGLREAIRRTAAWIPK